MYKMFDVYNNGFTWGGKMKKILDRYILVDQNDRIHLTKSNIYPKVHHRRFLDDITLRIGIQTPVR